MALRQGFRLSLPLPAWAAAFTTSSTALADQAHGAGAVKAMASKPPLMKEFQIYRWNPDSPEKPKYTSYKVDINR
jgi:succinate dehydrogenase (ubiquinone) iron-sulfur subunit